MSNYNVWIGCQIFLHGFSLHELVSVYGDYGCLIFMNFKIVIIVQCQMLQYMCRMSEYRLVLGIGPKIGNRLSERFSIRLSVKKSTLPGS